MVERLNVQARAANLASYRRRVMYAQCEAETRFDGVRSMAKGEGPCGLCPATAVTCCLEKMRKGEWRHAGLALVRSLRADHRSCPKIDIARAIAAAVPGAPRNVEAIAVWLRDREQTGELDVRSVGKAQV